MKNLKIVMKNGLIHAFVFLTMSMMILSSCGSSSENGDPENPDEKISLRPVLKIDDNLSSVSAYKSYIYLFRTEDNSYVAFQKSENSDDLKKFENLNADKYTMVAVAVSKADNLVVPEGQATKEDFLAIRDLRAEIPGIVYGKATAKLTGSAALEISNLKLMTGSLSITLKNTGEEITKVEVVIPDLYDRLNLDGKYSASKDDLTKTVELVKKNGSYTSTVNLMPTSKTSLSLRFFIHKGSSESGEYSVTFDGQKVEAGKTAVIDMDIENIFQDAVITGGITYIPWGDTAIDADDEIEL